MKVPVLSLLSWGAYLTESQGRVWYSGLWTRGRPKANKTISFKFCKIIVVFFLKRPSMSTGKEFRRCHGVGSVGEYRMKAQKKKWEESPWGKKGKAEVWGKGEPDGLKNPYRDESELEQHSENCRWRCSGLKGRFRGYVILWKWSICHRIICLNSWAPADWCFFGRLWKVQGPLQEVCALGVVLEGCLWLMQSNKELSHATETPCHGRLCSFELWAKVNHFSLRFFQMFSLMRKAPSTECSL